MSTRSPGLVKITWVRNVFRGYYSAQCRVCTQVFTSALIIGDAMDSAHLHLERHKYVAEQVEQSA